MKTFIVGLFSLVVLASGAAWGHKDPEGTPNNKNLPALQGFCQANKGIFVILVKNDGEAHFAKCKEVGPAKPITNTTSIRIRWAIAKRCRLIPLVSS